MKSKRRVKKAGFTIIELLTVMAIIAVLIGLLVPALAMVKDSAKVIQQQAQFHSIKVGITGYESAFKSFPTSTDNEFMAISSPVAYCGANKLAEAMVGWDLLGLHPKSEFTVNGATLTPPPTVVYNATPANLSERKEHYVELENANVFRLRDVYGSMPFGNGNLMGFNYYAICDVFTKKRDSGLKTGTPILYFKANAMYTFQNSLTTLNANGTPDDVYNYDDNVNLLDLGVAGNPTLDHPLADGTTDLQDFDDILRNEQVFNVSNSFSVPYCAQSYVLMSAGKDGLFGTADDVYSFEKEQ